MPSLWLEEEGEQFQYDPHTHNNDTHPPYSNEAQNPFGEAGPPAGPYPQTQTSYSAQQQQLPSNNAGSSGGFMETTYSPGPYSWEAASTPMISKQQQALDLMMAAAAQYPDDIDRSRWNNDHLQAQDQPSAANNDLSYSPAFSDSPLISPSAARQSHQPRRRSSDIDSLFEDSEDEEEIYVLQRRDAAVGDGDDKDSPASAVLPHVHDHDRPSPCGLSRQLQGQLNVLSSEEGVEPEEDHVLVHVQPGDDIHAARQDEKVSQRRFQDEEEPDEVEEILVSHRVPAPTGQLSEQHREPETRRHEKIHNCACGCSTAECSCHPSSCECLGWDHTEQARQLKSEAEKKWGPGYEGHPGVPGNVQSCGCGDVQKKKRCSCLPGLCHCATCSEHGGHGMVEPVNHCGCDAIAGGKRCQCQPDHCACADCDEHKPSGCGERYDAPTEPEVYQQQAAQSRLVDDGAPPQTQEWQRMDSFVGDKQKGTDIQATHPCGCTQGHTCSCPSGRCECPTAYPPVEGGREVDSQQSLSTQPCLCREGQDCTCSPGACRCRKAECAPDKGTSHREEEPSGPVRARGWASAQYHRPLHLKLAELIENPMSTTMPAGNARTFSRMESVLPAPPQPPTPAFSQRSSVHPSRPDTPRPPLDRTPSTPYAADVLQDYFQQSIEPGLLPSTQEDVRQSVEPEMPPPDWARESTPAYEDRSFTPSPISRQDANVEMRDASPTLLPGDLGRELSLPPPTSQPDPSIGDHLPVSPVRLAPPLIPDGSPSIKQPKRGERRKSAVHGSKVEKHSTTGSTAKPKSRNVTRKPTASVGKLVDKAKKRTKEAAAEIVEGGGGHGQSFCNGPQLPTMTTAKQGGKVAAAVEKIERQVKQQDEEKNLKQKDGTAVRRSQRANKGVRNSFGYT